MRTLGIIPARIGSSGVRKKNIRPLAGRPLVAYAVESALESRLDRVVVSTDALEIANVARGVGAEVPFLRPPELAINEAPAMCVVRHTLDWLEVNDGWRPEAVAYLQPTSPFRTARHIDDALALLDGAVNSVWTMVPVAEHPYFMYRPEEDGRLIEYVDLPNKPERRQDVLPIYHVNPMIALSRTSYLTKRARPNDLVVDKANFRALIISREDGLDINTEFEFQMAALLMRQRRLGEEMLDIEISAA